MKSETKCEYCDRPAVYMATSEGDPYVLACDECCRSEGHFEDGHSVRLDDARGLLELVNARPNVSVAIAGERSELIEAICDESVSCQRSGYPEAASAMRQLADRLEEQWKK